MIASKSQPPATQLKSSNEAAANRENRLLRRIAILALALGSVSALSLNLVDPDLWGHIRYAEDWLAAGELPQTALHTFSATDQPWINHENLAELSFALGYRYLGVTGLLIAKSLLGLSLLLAMVWIARRQGVPLLAAWLTMGIVAAGLHSFFFLRPQLLSFAFFAITLTILEVSFHDWQTTHRFNWRPLALLPLVFAVWANTHGAFVVGLGVVTVYLLGRTYEFLTQTPPNTNSDKKPAIVLLGITLLSLAATLATPYGLELHRWLLQSLSQSRPEITEWAAPSIGNPVFWPWIALLTTTVFSLLLTRERRDPIKLILLAIVAWQSAQHMRHIAFFALLYGFWMPVHFYSAVSRIRFQLPHSVWLRRMALVALFVGIGKLSFGIDQQLSQLPVARSDYPLDAVQFMADRGLQGKLVVSFNWAQYAVAALAPEVQVGFDGRFRTCYSQEVIDMNFDFLLGEFGGRRSRSPSSGPINPLRVLEQGSPDLVLLDRHYDNAVEVMQRNPAWVLLFRDRVAEIWGRRQRYDNPLGPHYFPVALRVQDPRPREGSIQWPALPIREKPPLLASQKTTFNHKRTATRSAKSKRIGN